MDFDSLPNDAAPPQAAVAQPNAIDPDTAGTIPIEGLEQPQSPQVAGNIAHGVMDFDSLQDDSAKYSTPEQKLKAAGEGALKGALGPVGTFINKDVFDAKPADIRGRAEANPIIHGVSEAAGLGAGLLIPGEGQLGALGKAGELVAEGVGLGTKAAETSSYAYRVGSEAVKQATEMAIMQSGDEVSKMILKDPNQTAQQSIADVGLAAALGGIGGGVFAGAVSPLWKATVGKALGSATEALTDAAGGIEGKLTPKASELELKSGITLPPELKSVIDGAPGAKLSHSTLSQTDNTIAGRAYQKSLRGVEEQAADRIVSSLGESLDSLESRPQLDKYAIGREATDSLAKQIDNETKPLSQAYDKVTDFFKNSEIGMGTKIKMTDDIANMALTKRLAIAPDESSKKLVDTTIEKLQKNETIDDLKLFATNLREGHQFGDPTYQTAKDLRSIISDHIDNAISDNINKATAAGKSPITPEGYADLRRAYKDHMGKIDDLAEHLSVGKYHGPQSFTTALRDLGKAKGEMALNQLAGTNRADMIQQLQQYPETLNVIRKYHVDQLLDKATSKAKPGSLINTENLRKGIDGLSPQIKSLVATPEQHAAIDAAGQILDGLKDPTHNFSNTARTIAKMTHATPTAMSLIAALMGHADVGIATYLGKIGLTEGKDAIKLGLMKFMGSNAENNPAALKSMVTYIASAQKAEKLFTKSVENVFKPGAMVLAENLIPTVTDRLKLDKMVMASQANPEAFMQKMTNQDLGHYMPDHSTAMAQAMTNQVQYLQSLKPQPFKPGPFDKEIPASPAQVGRYNRALDIAEQPAIVLQHIKDGTLLDSDILDLHKLYPEVYQKMAQKLTDQASNYQAGEAPIPYNTRMGVSLFLGQPLDSTMEPSSIIAAQPMPKQDPQQGPSKGAGGRSMKEVGKSNATYQTPSQASESDRATRRPR